MHICSISAKYIIIINKTVPLTLAAGPCGAPGGAGEHGAPALDALEGRGHADPLHHRGAGPAKLRVGGEGRVGDYTCGITRMLRV